MSKPVKKNRSNHIGQNSSPNQDKSSNSPKKSRTEVISMNISNIEVDSVSMDEDSPHSVQNQITIDTEGSHPVINQFSRLDFINS